MKIMITEDDPGIEDVFKLILEKSGFEVILKPDGMELINNHFELPDLFIIDKQLSGVDGLDICAHLKTRQLTAQVPVIMVSASPSVEALAKKAGADDFLEKPFNRKEILKLVRKHLDKGT